jgi:glycosyltransferase involved in cell wall biosynthesis
MNDPKADPGERDRRLFGVLVTFRRPEEFSMTLGRLAAQERPLDRLVVVDNSSIAQNETYTRAYGSQGHAVDYVPMPTNLGFAGGVAEGMERVLAFADDRDWIVVLDDDDPPQSSSVLGELATFGEAMLARDPQTAVVGLVGGRFDWKRGSMLRVPDAELDGPVPVDFIGGGHLPLYLTEAIRSVGPFSRDIFFGLSEVEHGLRLRRAGYAIYADGPRWRENRAEAGRLGLKVRPSRRLPDVSWRRYYSLRNAIFILRSAGERRAALRLTLVRGLGKPFLNLPLAPSLALRHLALNSRACWDGWTGRMGRRIEPDGSPRK